MGSRPAPPATSAPPPPPRHSASAGLRSASFAGPPRSCALGLAIVLALQIVMSTRVQRLTGPLFEYAESKAHAEADRILSDAREQARKMITEAQTQAAALIAAQKADIEARAHDYQSSLQSLSVKAEAAINEGAKKADEARTQLMQKLSAGIETESADLKKRLDRLATDMDAFLEHAKAQSADIDRAFTAAGKAISDQVQKKVDEAGTAGMARIDAKIDGLLKEADEEVDAYRLARKKLIDEHMADLIAEASKIVLKTSLTPQQHGELVERALEEARSAGML